MLCQRERPDRSICGKIRSMDNDPARPDIHELLARIAPPTIPDESLTANPELGEIKHWHKRYASSLLAGLQTEPSYHANDTRFDWLQRLVLSKAAGRKKPSPRDLQRVLNAGLEKAKVLRLEDPIEDAFCDLIATRQGSLRILRGRWEDAFAYTQTLLDAFEDLPEGGQKADALTAVYALLRLSDQVCERAGVDRGSISGGAPMASIELPSKEALTKLARRVRFTAGDLNALGVDPGALNPFLLQEEHFQCISDRPIGDTPMEFYPLLPRGDGVEIVSPTGLSMAVRAALISVAIAGGMDERLQHNLLDVQQRFSEVTGFWPTPRLKLPPPNEHNIRAAVLQNDEGQYLHIIQVPTVFDGFPEIGFTSVRNLPQEAEEFIAQDIERFWTFAEKKGDARRIITVMLYSGWGGTHSWAPPIDDDRAPDHWQFLALSFAEAAVLGACDDGKLSNVLRLHEQVSRLEQDGFTLANPNGLLNLFGFWRMTKGNIVPEHLWEMTPPCHLSMGVDELLKPRLEALHRQDRRALPLPGGGYEVVQRKQWGEELQPIYASVDDLNESRLTGAVSFASRTIWIESESRPSVSRAWQYQVWNAVLQWLVAIGPKIAAANPELMADGEFRVSLGMPNDRDGRITPLRHDHPVLTQCLRVNRSGPIVQIEILDGWASHLAHAENRAEIALMAAVLEGLADPTTCPTWEELIELVRAAIGSDHWRWLHAIEVSEPLARLAARGLIAEFKPISLSAHSLVKYGSVWSFRSREDGSEIAGVENCREFLKSYRDSMLESLIGDIRKFNRAALATAAARSFQAARREQIQWQATIRAQRSIHGQAANVGAFKRHNECNAILRAAKSICEIAACEARAEGGLKPASAEIEEMFAKALLLFGNGQLFAAIRGGLISPTLRVSPGGDVLSERDILSKLLEPAASWLHTQRLDASDERYGSKQKRDEPAPDGRNLDQMLRASLEAEYRVSAEGYVDFQFAAGQLAEIKRRDVFVAKHSELLDALRRNPSHPPVDAAEMLKRLTLKCRSSWHADLSEADLDLARFDRRYSLINRPLLALDDSSDPCVLVAPAFISDSIMYSVSGLHRGSLNNAFWESAEARRYSGAMGDRAGHEFEEKVARRLRELGLHAESDCRLSKLLNQKVSDEFGNVDVFALTKDGLRAWVVEAKDLRICRTETEVASRLSEYRGRTNKNSKGKDVPDNLLRHLRRVQYLRERAAQLAKTLKLSRPPEVKGLLVVDSPQPMNFYMLEDVPDAASVFLDAIDSFGF